MGTIKRYSNRWGTVFFFLGLFGFFWPLGPVSLWAGHEAISCRVVSMAPNITETVFALGRGDWLVGVSDFCVYPPPSLKLPKVGGFFNPNLERLAALKPDLVLLQGNHDKVDRFCRTRNIRALHVAMDSLPTIYSGIDALGEALHASKKARDLNQAIRRELAAVETMVSAYGNKTVFVSLGRAMGSMANLYTVGGASFLSQVLHVAGGENIFQDVAQPYPEASKESLIKRAPAVILEMRPGETISADGRKRIVEEWQVFHHIPAVAAGNIQVITEDFVLLPGPRVGQVARILAKALHGKKR